MTESPLKKIVAELAGEVCAEIDLAPEALKLLTPAAKPGVFLESLIAGEHLIDAVKFLARALPKREATWWACLCARDGLPPDAASAETEALASAERWVYQPIEENRRAAFAAAEAAEFAQPASWAAMAAFWSGGSMAPPDVAVVPPADNLTAKAVAGAIQLAAVRTEPEKADEKYLLFLRRGLDIAAGGNGRPPEAPG